VLFTVVVLGLGLAAAPGPASAATAVPWDFVQVQAIGSTAIYSYLPLTAYCPVGFTPISGGISGPGPFDVINEYATYWNNSFSEQIFAQVDNGTWILTVECAQADQVGAIQVIAADFDSNSSGLAGGWVTCPAGTRVIGGGADWNMAGDRYIAYAAPSDDGASWYATGKTYVTGNTLHVEAYCADAGELAAAQRVTQAYTDPPSGTNLVALCPTNTRTLTGGVYAALAGSGVDPGQNAGLVQDSFPDMNRLAWHASVP
jgi:hypothetical protein